MVIRPSTLLKFHHSLKQCKYRLLYSAGCKGSHGTLYLGDRYTIMKDRKREIGPGQLKKMFNDPGLDKSDIE